VAAIATLGRAANAQPPKSVTLLVHGLRLNPDAPLEIWGMPSSSRTTSDGVPRWTGLIGTLQKAGYRFGGVIRPRGETIDLPASLDRSHTAGDAQRAALFSLEFSPSANRGGLALQANELSQCIAELRRFTGCGRVNLVAHSAGGLAARVYVQSALSAVPYRGDVARLITIATPHQGSKLAELFGDLVGPRLAELRPESPTIRTVNDRLPLPSDVLFASIVVRGMAIGISGLEWPADAYEPHVRRDLLARLPVDYRKGGDQVVHVVSQNLRLARTAAAYETAAGRPVLGLLARVQDPSPEDRSPTDATAHQAAPSDKLVGQYVQLLLSDVAAPWSAASEEQRAGWRRLQASLAAIGVVEEQAAARHRFSVVQQVTLQGLEPMDSAGPAALYRFAGTARWPERVLGLGARTTSVAGTLHLVFDQHGQVTQAQRRVVRVVDE
jgi:pimeloyl-ACP methyl ester carboxylesterase